MATPIPNEHRTVRWYVKRTFRRWLQPSLNDLHRVADIQTTDAGRILTERFGISVTRADGYREELEESVAENPNRAASLSYPERMAIEMVEAGVIYSLIRARKPQWMIETGVANGFSSFAILSAMRRNGAGRLVSFDPGRDVGAVVPTELRNNGWELVRAPLREDRGIPPLDLFMHDSAHDYANQLREYRIAWRHLNPGGVLMSDDIDASYAFIAFCRMLGRRPDVLVGSRKAFGLLVKPAASPVTSSQ